MIELRNCQKVYPNGHIGIKDVNVSFPTKGLVGIYGKSGCGKTTLFNCISGVDKFTKGKIVFNGKEALHLYNYTAIVFQESKLLEEMTVAANLIIACPNTSETDLDSMLKKFDLYEYKNEKVHSMSVGERQRVEIMRSLLQEVDIILCDEPTANLDEENKEIIFRLLKEYSQEKLILVISHDRELLQQYTKDFLVIDKGMIVENHIQIPSLEAYEPKKMASKGIPLKYSAWMALNNIKKNKFKSVMTFVFLFLSLLMITAMFSIMNMELSQIFYESFKEKEVGYINLKPFDEETKHLKEDVTEEDIQTLDPEIISYDDVTFAYKYKNKMYYADSIWKSNKPNANYTMMEDEIYISEKVAASFGNHTKDAIGQDIDVGTLTLTIKGILPDTKEASILFMNENTFEKTKGNYLWNDCISLSYGNYEVRSVEVYNPCHILFAKNEPTYHVGKKPEAKQEIALPNYLLNQYNLTLENAIGKSIVLNIKAKEILPMEYTITGVTYENLVLSDEEVFDFLAKYGCNSVEVSASLGMITLTYSEKLIHQAILSNYLPVHDLTDTVLRIYYMLQGFIPFLSIIAGILIIISIFTILNSANLSIMKNKKNIGVLLSIKIRKPSILTSFWMEHLIIGSITVLIAFLLSPILFSYINSAMAKATLLDNLDLSFMQLKYWIFFVVILISIGITFVGVMLPFINISRKKAIDILYDR